MTPSEFTKAFSKLTPDKIRELGVMAVQRNSNTVISDALVANAEGLTFAGNKINDYPPFSDWEETGEFHEHLHFQSNKDIEFTSRGKGFQSIDATFPYNDTIAPSAKILDGSTISDIKIKFIEQINNILL